MSKQFTPFILFPADADGRRFIQLNEDKSLQLFTAGYPHNRPSLDKVRIDVLTDIGMFYKEHYDEMEKMPGFSTMIDKLSIHFLKACGGDPAPHDVGSQADDILDFIDVLVNAYVQGICSAKERQSTKAKVPADSEPTVAEQAVCQDEKALREKYKVLVTPIPEHKYRKCLVKYFINKEFDYDPYGNASVVIKLPESTIEWTVRHECNIRSWFVTPKVENKNVISTMRFDNIGQVINYIMVNTTM